ncbi:PH domain-containing protein [Bacteroides stercorirosoris]|uniref:PH domain-containing protein n=1 Tax=Bacteroides stercorirosoris TaxID=871324 RepID=A0A1M6D093_9BACE|nr:PH domain-containing protein [Bacteroides stercorirosoris]OKZ06581.1 MAG: ABC transporter [Bacteroides oleiciplenus]SHI66687.1 PH domain-containing protein [Bacteroides stercorirosoris]
MNRIFHARIAAGQYLFLLIATAATIHEMWMKHAVMAIIFMLLLIIAIERLIHTTYTLTADGRLILYFGRFTRSKEVLLKDIISVERTSSMKIGCFAVMRYVLVRYGTEGKCAVLLPVKEDMFIKMLRERLREEASSV